MKANKLFWTLAAVFAALSMSVAFSSCENDDPTNDSGVDNFVPGQDGDASGDGVEEIASLTQEQIEELLKEVEEPGSGKIRFAVGVTEGQACKGLGFEGAWNGYNVNKDTIMVGQYQDGLFIFDLDAMDKATFGKSKFILLDEKGKGDWQYQAMTDGYILKDENVVLADDMGQKALNLTSDDLDNVVIKIIITTFQTPMEGCGPEVAAIPAGTAKFVFTDESGIEADQYIFTGEFAENAWAESDRVMTKQEDGTYVWEGEYPENFRFKVIAVVGGELKWMEGDDIKVTAEDKDVIEFSGTFAL